jgi:PAS domain S-box-containing protein
MPETATHEGLAERIAGLDERLARLEQALAHISDIQDRYRALFDRSNYCVYVHDLSGNFLEANEAALNLVGYGKEDIHSMNFGGLLDKDQLPKAYKNLESLLKTGAHEEMGRYRLKRKDGGHVWVETDACVIYRQGEPYAIQGVARDITDLKRAGEALLESEEKYRTLVEESFDGIFVQEGPKIVFANQRLHDMLGYSEGELLGMRHWLVYHPEYQQLTRSRAEARMRGEKVPSFYEVKLQRKDGSWFYGEVNARAIRFGGRPGVQVWIRDVTERKEVEKVLRESEARYRTILESIEDGYYEVDVTGHFTFLNDSFCKIVGYSRDELLGRSYRDFTDRQEAESVYEIYNEVFRSGEPSRGFGWEVIGKDGAKRYCEVSAVLIQTQEGSKIGFRGVMRDVSERRQTELALKESEARYRNLFDSVNDFIFTHDLEGRFLTMNRAASRILGYTQDELVGRPVSDLMLSNYRGAFKNEYLAQLREEGHFEGVSIYRAKDGTEHYVEYRNILVQPEGENPYVTGVGRDITERVETRKEIRKVEKQFHHAQKLEAVGTLAGGIAHDFNNLLAGIQMNNAVVKMHTSTSHPHYRRLRAIETLVKSAAQLTKQLLGFARGGKYDVKAMDLNEVIARTLEMFGRTRKQIRIHTKYEKEIWPVEADQGQMEQVLMNLYVNAWQAMPRGGDLYVETHNVFLDEHYVKPFQVKPGKYLKISVRDTGTGIHKDIIERIFEPFFTTREKGKGTGLGLASAYGIIRNHDGLITVYSEKGKGASFNVYLPASQAKLIREEMPPQELMRGSETVLLVDDEELILEAGRAAIESLGYTVWTASSGKEAFKIYEANTDRIDLIILDMVMPDIDGRQTYERLEGLDPGVKVLLSSGYSLDGEASQMLNAGCAGFLQKPFDIVELSKTIREILDGE